MARKSQILRLITLIALMALFIIIMMNIFGSGQSYYYIHVERRLQMQQQKYLDPKIRPNIPFLNKTTQLRDTEDDFDIMTILPQIQKDIPSLPITYYFSRFNSKSQRSDNCAKYPTIQLLNFYNTYWQTFYSGQIIFHLYGAYYDERHSDGPYVRILAMSDHIREEFPTNYCQFWFEDDKRPIVTEIIKYEIIWRKHWNVVPLVYYPYLMTCKLPKDMNIIGNPIPKVVSLVERQCDTANNSIRIIYDKLDKRQIKQHFAVCVKGLDYLYEDYSERLVEWLEMLKLLGVYKVYMYELQIHPNMRKVLDYYISKGFIEVQKTTLVGGVVDAPHLEHWLIKTYRLNKRVNELIPYNDCFYRNMYKYDYIALLDIDEIIMPLDGLKTWQDLVLTTLNYSRPANCSSGMFSLCARNVYYPTVFENQLVPTNSYPTYMHMLNHGYRFVNFTAPLLQIKCLHDTQNAIAVHNHLPISYVNNSCYYHFPTNHAQMAHYRNTIPKIAKDEIVGGLTWDNNMERFKEPLIGRCTKVLKELNLLS